MGNSDMLTNSLDPQQIVAVDTIDYEKRIRKIRELQLDQIELIKIFLEICEKENLTYYMSAGTMLGAVRHKGYIPWDDDADFMMPRPDYERFLQVANQYLRGKRSGIYKIEHYSKNPDLFFYPIRITSSKRQVHVTSALKFRDEDIWIDVFPLDGMPNNRFVRFFHSYRLLFTRALFMLSIFEDWVQVNKPNRPWHERMLITLAKRFPIQRLLSYPKRWKALDKVLTKYSCEKSDYWLNLCGGGKLKEMFPKPIYGKGTLYDFEGMKIIGVDDYDTYLTGLYGDYMTFPPVEERTGHISLYDE